MTTFLTTLEPNKTKKSWPRLFVINSYSDIQQYIIF